MPSPAAMARRTRVRFRSSVVVKWRALKRQSRSASAQIHSKSGGRDQRLAFGAVFAGISRVAASAARSFSMLR